MKHLFLTRASTKFHRAVWIQERVTKLIMASLTYFLPFPTRFFLIYGARFETFPDIRRNSEPIC